MSDVLSLNVGFIGSGAMASAMMQGLLKQGKSPLTMIASDPYEGCRANVAALGITATSDNAAVAKFADVIVIATKPNVVVAALESIAACVDAKSKLVVSIAAGVPLTTMEAALGAGARVVRTMPNTPCLVGEAAVGVAPGAAATAEDVGVAKGLFTGVTVEVAEKDLDAVTALSGSGPAYVFLFIEALADAGVRAGLTRAVAMQLAAQTVKGAAAMQIATGTHPAVLKDQVCSPGGTTIAGVEALEQNGFRAATMAAVSAANARSKEMSTANKK
ncbi:pyrroline-5-carboxylate reductase dimerization-domain-containing protein [Pelagophyceae sp. CCMP2097]|nr:pyrroline-5-carboxylate reductase dimerization-domain-containing protein [Pelagophyceae sp. CCMP2097]